MTASISSSAIITRERRIATSTFWLCGQNQQQQCVESSVTDPFQCFKLLRELNGQVSAYHQLATSLGTSSGDGQNLRGRLKRTRRRARQLASTVRRFILTLDNVGESSSRLWCLLYCCLYVLALEMQRTLQLQCTFALHPAAGFINTGLVIQHQEQQQHKQKKRKINKNRRLQNHESSCLVDDDDDVPLADLLSLERAEINQLQQEIEELEGALQELRTNYNVVEIESYLTVTDAAGGHLERLQDSSVLCQHHNRSIINNATTTTTCYYYSNDSASGASGYCNVADDSVGSSSSSYADDDQEEEQEEDSASVVNQRRCLCVVMAIVIIVFILATILGAAL